MNKSEFAGDEFEFAVGSLQGLRAWNMDDLGRLHGVTHREVWRPGENVSVCKATKQVPCPETLKPEKPKRLSEEAVLSKKERKRRERDEFTFHIGYSRLNDPSPCGRDLTCDGLTHTVESGHRFDPSCQCGFWAYDEASFTPQGDIVGVIDAYGKTTIGTKGFRAEKARVIGLSRMDRNDKPLSRSVVFRLASLYPEVQFYDDLPALIDAHDAVLKQWAEVGEEFWLTPVPTHDDGLLRWSSSSLTASYANLYRRYAAYGGLTP